MAHRPHSEIDPQTLKGFLDAYIPENMERSHVPGLVIAVVQGDEILLSKGYGYADLEDRIPMTPQTNVRAGSVSKPVLSTAVIQLVQQGILDLDAPVSDYISDLDLADEYGPASTVGQLLNHTGGYEDVVVLSHAPDLEHWAPLGDVLRADLPPRAFAPGVVQSYSSWDYALLGYAIEQVTGLPYEDAVTQLLFAPLGMENSTYAQPLPPEIHGNLAVGYGWNYSKTRYDIIPHDFVRMSPGVALITNGEDMGNYMRALLNGGSLDRKRIFDDRALAMLLERQASAHPFSRGRSYAFTELTLSARKVLYHDGNGIGFMSRIVLMPEQDLGIFISVNHRNLYKGMSLTQAAAMVRTLSAEILEQFVPETEVEIRQVSPLPDRAGRIGRFTGHYQAARISRGDFFKLEGMLDNVDVKDGGDGSLRIGSGVYVEVEPLLFQSVEHPGFFVVFAENAAGQVEFLTFGGTGSYQRVPWYQSKAVQIRLVAAVALLSLSMLIVWPITRQGHWMAWVVSLLSLGFVVGVGLLFVTEITDLLLFFKAVPLGVRILFALPWIIGVLSLSLPLFLALMWRDGNTSWWARIHYALVTLASFALFWLADFWNLILRIK
jgi:CubicO group peptidase (beta-lactamase class C family)